MLSRRRFLRDAGMGALAFQLPLRALAAFVPPARLYAARYYALGTHITFAIDAPDRRLARHAVQIAVRQIYQVHQEMTLFEPSPLRDANASAAARPVVLQAATSRVLERGLALARRTQGCFDPCRRGDAAPRSARAGAEMVSLDVANQTLRLAQPDFQLDLNGIAKGYAVDAATAQLRAQGLARFVVNAGGDLFAAGNPEDHPEGWQVEVADPLGGERPAATLLLRDQAAATSGNAPRGAAAPHLWDPRTGALTSPVRSATVVAATAMDADALATAAFVGGPTWCRAHLAACGAQRALLVRHGGALTQIS